MPPTTFVVTEPAFPGQGVPVGVKETESSEGWDTTMLLADVVHPLASRTVTEYEPAGRLATFCVVAPLFHANV